MTGADAEGLRLSCADGTAVVVPRDQVESRVRHGWALTAHQAAGGRWPAVVVVLPGDAAQTLSRPWVYTAFGRAERHLSVVHGVDPGAAPGRGRGPGQAADDTSAGPARPAGPGGGLKGGAATTTAVAPGNLLGLPPPSS
ncbi:hypothetical protein Sdagh_14290 [Streptomyces daghestanicus]|uniref:UvrD-like helicase C-terminal domain-containing protein n=1 Tax=Streptomyces daghestanicus TaxID=66885 RepID=A0ABQ3PXF6_9ACTN|nr:hypothetical protein Sdagh_14290 [Streptomyces daghestanicus]